MIWVPTEHDKHALVSDPSTPFFTTDHFDGHASVLVQESRLGEVDREVIVELVQEAWLSQASRTRANRWLADQGLPLAGVSAPGRRGHDAAARHETWRTAAAGGSGEPGALHQPGGHHEVRRVAGQPQGHRPTTPPITPKATIGSSETGTSHHESTPARASPAKSSG